MNIYELSLEQLLASPGLVVAIALIALGLWVTARASSHDIDDDDDGHEEVVRLPDGRRARLRPIRVAGRLFGLTTLIMSGFYFLSAAVGQSPIFALSAY